MAEYQTKINPKVRKFAEKFGVKYVVGETPKDAGIAAPGFSLSKRVIASYFGDGLVFVKSRTHYPPVDMDIACLHELGHAILGYYPLHHIGEVEEIKANAIALGFAAELGLPVTENMIENFNLYSKEVRKA